MATPQLLADLQLPASLDLLGQQIDLAPLQVRRDGWADLHRATALVSRRCQGGILRFACGSWYWYPR